MRSLSETNCSGVIVPARSADSPYWTPTLSAGLYANPVSGSRPSTLTICSKLEHFTPSGLVTGSQRASSGIAGLQESVAVTRLAKNRSQFTHELNVPKPLTAVLCALVQPSAPASGVAK